MNELSEYQIQGAMMSDDFVEQITEEINALSAQFRKNIAREQDQIKSYGPVFGEASSLQAGIELIKISEDTTINSLKLTENIRKLSPDQFNEAMVACIRKAELNLRERQQEREEAIAIGSRTPSNVVRSSNDEDEDDEGGWRRPILRS